MKTVLKRILIIGLVFLTVVSLSRNCFDMQGYEKLESVVKKLKDDQLDNLSDKEFVLDEESEIVEEEQETSLMSLIRMRPTFSVTADYFGGGSSGGSPNTSKSTDEIAPTITLKGPNPLELSYGQEYIEYGATATDNKDGKVAVLINKKYLKTTVGEHRVEYTARDSSNNTVTISRIVRIIDKEAPQISLIGSTIVNIGYKSVYMESGALVKDNVDGEKKIGPYRICFGGRVVDELNTGRVGQYTLYYQYEDSSTNKSKIIVRFVNVSSSGQKNNDGDIAGKFLKGKIYEKGEIFETKYFKIRFMGRAYVPGYAYEYMDLICDAIEKVTGLNYYNKNYNRDKIKIFVQESNPNSDSEYSSQGIWVELGGNSDTPEVHLSPNILLVDNVSTFLHELIHVLELGNSKWFYGRSYSEGYATYLEIKVLRYLESTNIEVAKTLGPSYSVFHNIRIYGDIYAKPIQYWLINDEATYRISNNGPYAVGGRFMHYLDEVYGDCSAWFMYYENKKPYYLNQGTGINSNMVPSDEQLNIMIQVYGQDVFDNFYDWLRNNEERYKKGNEVYDLSELEYTYIYPSFNADGSYIRLSNQYKVKYKDLYICIDELKNYMQNYKNKNMSALRMKLANKVKVALYDNDNNLLCVETNDEFSLEGVSYIQLIGEGILYSYDKYSLEIFYN